MALTGLRIITLESRRSDLAEKLILEQGGECFNAPSVRERPLDSNPQVVQFAKELIAARYDMVIFTTGVGTRYLVDALAASGLVESFIEALKRVSIVSRGPKPAAGAQMTAKNSPVSGTSAPTFASQARPGIYPDIIEACLRVRSRPCGSSRQIRSCRIPT